MNYVGQEGHLSKLNRSMVEGTSFTDLNEGLQFGAEILDMAVPGLSLVIKAVTAVYDLAKRILDRPEESARLMSFCAVMATALTRFKVRDTPELRAALDEAENALQKLLGTIKEHMKQSTIALMFTSSSYKLELEKVKLDVEKAVRKAMDEAQFLVMEDAVKTSVGVAKIKNDVALLLERRYEGYRSS
jgi:hypothetical protein